MKILFSTENGSTRATGVSVQSTDRTYGATNWTLSARKEVIVSAGVYHSPQLLMVSGIGPADTLASHNISLIKTLPGVGQNMHDSCAIGGVLHNTSVPKPTVTQQDIDSYIANATGLLTNSGGDVLGWEKLPAKYRQNLSNNTLEMLAQWPSDWPEVEYVAQNTGGPADAVQAEFSMLLIATFSRGNVTLRTNSMLDKPIISTNWLLDEADQEVAIQAYRRAREFWSHFPKSINVSEEVTPGANVTTDAELLEVIRGQVSAIHHGTSTCMMGQANETMAVVDSHARVFGVKDLRVIDSSSFRFTPPGHTQGATCKWTFSSPICRD